MDRRDSKHKESASGSVNHGPDHGNDFIFGDPEEDGIALVNLKRGDKIRVETITRGGVGLVIDMTLINPAAGLVDMTRIIQRTGFYTRAISERDIGIETPFVRLRSYVYSKRSQTQKLRDGWLGLNCTLVLNATTINQPVKTILVNGAVIFPPQSTARH